MKEDLFSYIEGAKPRRSFIDRGNILYLDCLLCCMNYDNYCVDENTIRNFFFINRFNNDKYLTLFNNLCNNYPKLNSNEIYMKIRNNFIRLRLFELKGNQIIINKREFNNYDLAKAHYLINFKLLEYIYTVKDSSKDYNDLKNIKEFDDTKSIFYKYKKLEKKLTKQFLKKNIIGDIYINDEEYRILLHFFINSYKRIYETKLNYIIDIPFAITLIEIGKRRYDGAFWKYFYDETNIDFSNNRNKDICVSFMHTLKSYNKYYNDEISDYFENILLHSFITDKYKFAFYDFLFDFYRLDLLRNIQNNKASVMNKLLNVIACQDTSERGYYIRRHTSLAIGGFPNESRNKIKKMLKLIDLCFWDQEHINSGIIVRSALKKSIFEWANQSNKLLLSYNNDINSGYSRERKQFFSPSIYCNLRLNKFEIMLPEHIIDFDIDNNQYQWVIEYDDNVHYINDYIYSNITANKTNDNRFSITIDSIFSEFILTLIVNKKILRKYTIKKDKIRIFNIRGNMLNTFNIPSGEIIIYGSEEFIPISDGKIEDYQVGKYIKATYDLQDGDILRFPNNKIEFIGKFFEGLQVHGLMKKVYAEINGKSINVYNKVPKIIIEINKDQIAGTAILINGDIYKLQEFDIIISEYSNRKDKNIIEIDLSKIINKNSLYEIYINVPKDNRKFYYQFVLIKNFSFSFNETPYIFVNKGSIEILSDIKLTPINSQLAQEYIYRFSIDDEEDFLKYNTIINNINITLLFEIPILKWKFDNNNYHINMLNDMWKEDLPNAITIKGPFKKIELQFTNENEVEDNKVLAPIKKGNEFLFDLLRLKSWITNDYKYNNLYMNYIGEDNRKNSVKFIKIFPKSVVTSTSLIGDFENKLIQCNLDIYGKAEYYIDIKYLSTNDLIIDKGKLVNGKITCHHDVKSGLYEVIVYEKLKKKSYFKNQEFQSIYGFKQNLLNLKNLVGSEIKLIKIQKIRTGFSYALNINYTIKINNKIRNYYYGDLYFIINDKPYRKDVRLVFDEKDILHKVYIAFYEKDEEDWYPYLYDGFSQKIVISEEKGLPPSIKYHRYEYLSEEEYIYIYEFVKEEFEIDEDEVIEQEVELIPISK